VLTLKFGQFGSGHWRKILVLGFIGWLSLSLGACSLGARKESYRLRASPDNLGDSVHVSSGLVFPIRLGALARIAVDDYETQSPGLGFGYRYRGIGPTQGVEAIIYVYNLRVKQVPTDLQDSMLTQIRQMTRAEIAHQAQVQSLFARPVFGDTLSLKGETGPLEALFDGFVLETGSESAGRLLSGYHFSAIWTARNHFVKVKVLRAAQSTTTPEMLGAFLQAVLAQTHVPVLAPGRSADEPPSTEPSSTEPPSRQP
jgi:hypothetical protein